MVQNQITVSLCLCLLWSSTVGYPSDSLASCLLVVDSSRTAKTAGRMLRCALISLYNGHFSFVTYLQTSCWERCSKCCRCSHVFMFSNVVIIIVICLHYARSGDSTGYGFSHSRYARLVFCGDERHYEQWVVKFLDYMRLQKLKDTILSPDGAEIYAAKNEEAFAELIQFLDDKNLSLVMRDAVNDGKRQFKPRIMSLYTELTSIVKKSSESVTDYVIRAETASTALNNMPENNWQCIDCHDF